MYNILSFQYSGIIRTFLNSHKEDNLLRSWAGKGRKSVGLFGIDCHVMPRSYAVFLQNLGPGRTLS